MSEHLQNCSSGGVFSVCSGQYLSNVVQGRTRQQVHWQPWFVNGEQSLARVVRSNRQATVTQIARAGFDRKVSEYTKHQSLSCMGLQSGLRMFPGVCLLIWLLLILTEFNQLVKSVKKYLE